MERLVIGLRELVETANAEVAAMEAELTAESKANSTKDQPSRWPLRFIAAGEKRKGKCDV
ncbi:MAG TPA: hypothetical protein VMA09_23490 [Candidatus Binataceae bacterium]|nr:hypothetical protein [Candidatus Binataceae bacterium]